MVPRGNPKTAPQFQNHESVDEPGNGAYELLGIIIIIKTRELEIAYLGTMRALYLKPNLKQSKGSLHP